MNYIEKDKNMIYFHCDKRANPASLNINTGEFLSYGGGKVSTIPPYINIMLGSMREQKEHFMLGKILNDIACHKAILNATDYVLRMTVADKLDSANIRLARDRYGYYHLNDEMCEYINANFKALVKYAKNHENEIIHFDDFKVNLATEEILAELGLDELPEGFIQGMTENNINKKYLRNALGWYHRILPYYEHRYKSNWNLNNASGEFWKDMAEYYAFCEELGEEPRKSNNFLQEYVRVAETCRINKEKVDDEKLAVHQLSRANALSYENDRFMIVIPTTAEQFKGEAKMQDNCVYRIYLPKVVNGETFVVFIRDKKNPNHSFITCEVSIRGYIMQYLGKGNSYFADDSIEIAFKEEYQKHLSALWV